MKYSAIIKKLQKHQSDIAKQRDRLNEFADEINGLLDSCERADESLQDAIAALSELV